MDNPFVTVSGFREMKFISSRLDEIYDVTGDQVKILSV